MIFSSYINEPIDAKPKQANENTHNINICDMVSQITGGVQRFTSTDNGRHTWNGIRMVQQNIIGFSSIIYF
jgi:hypothetical protein